MTTVQLMRLLLLSLGFLLISCTITPPVIVTDSTHHPQPKQQELSTGWWYAQFRMVWPEGENPDWSLDALVAGEIIAPVLAQYRDNIELWRFHRRAARDGHDHVFSFIFYSSAATADQIYQDLENDSLLQQLKAEQIIIWTGVDDTEVSDRPEVYATSDPNWPEEIQKTWPVFIMGSSQMWLDLLQIYNSQLHTEADLIQRYQQVQAKLSHTWQVNGRHAWLHHLSAIFAYQPILMRY